MLMGLTADEVVRGMLEELETIAGVEFAIAAVDDDAITAELATGPAFEAAAAGPHAIVPVSCGSCRFSKRQNDEPESGLLRELQYLRG